MRKPLVVTPLVGIRDPSGADLLEIAYRGTSGDPTISGYRHGGRPDRKDEYGLSKIDIHGAALEGKTRFFELAARGLWDGSTRNDRYVSQRVWIRQKSGKLRPMDIPNERKRLATIYVRERLDKIVRDTGGLLPTVVAFRSFEDLYRDRPKAKGLTTQDEFAVVVLRLLREIGLYIVSVDLEDAFGRLPHQAIHAALRALGVCRDDRARIIDLVRIHSRCPGGAILRPKDRGIEQGGPLSPLVFNLVLDYLFRLVYGNARPQGASYGDDIDLVALSDAEARADFARFKVVAERLGFDNVRPLDGTGVKRSRVYDTRVTPVPLIKTFGVSPVGIRLIGQHDETLRSGAGPGQSFSSLRQDCTYKTVSKSYLREVLGLPGRQTCRPLGPYGFELAGEQVDHGPGDLDLLVGGEEDLVSSSPLGEDELVSASPLEENEMVSVSSCRSDVSADGSGGCVLEGPSPPAEIAHGLPPKAGLGLLDFHYTATTPPSSSSKEGGVPRRKDPRATAPVRGHRNGCLNGGGTGPSRPPSVLPVSILAPEHLGALARGRRVRAGDRYQGKVLDVRALDGSPESRLPFALGQCARLASKFGVARLLVDPTTAWVTNTGLLRGSPVEGWTLLELRDHPDGVVVVLGRARAKRVRPVRSARPVADLVLDRPKIAVADRRLVRVRVTAGGVTTTRAQRVDTLAPRDATRSALAAIIDEANPLTVTIPAVSGLKADLLIKKADRLKKPRRYRLVPLAQAMAILTRWDWVEHRDWLVGTRRQQRRDRDAGRTATGSPTLPAVV